MSYKTFYNEVRGKDYKVFVLVLVIVRVEMSWSIKIKLSRSILSSNYLDFSV